MLCRQQLCSGCKISGVPPIPDYCLGEYVPQKPSGGDVCSNWVTSSSTSYQVSRPTSCALIAIH